MSEKSCDVRSPSGSRSGPPDISCRHDCVEMMRAAAATLDLQNQDLRRSLTVIKIGSQLLLRNITDSSIPPPVLEERLRYVLQLIDRASSSASVAADAISDLGATLEGWLMRLQEADPNDET